MIIITKERPARAYSAGPYYYSWSDSSVPYGGEAKLPNLARAIYPTSAELGPTGRLERF